ncbi:MAG TPA: GntP family permease [Negativicutes bacterium]
MDWMYPVGIICSLSLIIFLALRGYSILVIGPVCTLLVIVTNQMDIAKALFTDKASYMMGVGGFITKYFIIFLLGAILAKYMEDSGAARSISNYMLKLTGTEKPFRVLLAVFIISSLLTYGGINVFVAMFAIVPLARPLFRALNIPWHLIMIPIPLGLATYTMSMLPGAPSIHNIIPTTVLGTTLMAAPLVGIVAAIVTVTFGLWYMKVSFVKAQKANEGYTVTAADEKLIDTQNLPPLGGSLVPMITLLVIIFVGSFLKIPNIILIALCVAIIIAAIGFNRYITKHSVTINAGALGSVTPAIFTAAAVGFGIVIAQSPGFTVISGWISAIPGGPLIKLSVATGLMSAVTGSSAGSLGIIMEAFAKQYLAQGVNPEVLHRIAAIASNPLAAMPHSGAVLTLLAITGLTHKDAYRHIFITVCVGGLLSLTAALVVVSLTY